MSLESANFGAMSNRIGPIIGKVVQEGSTKITGGFNQRRAGSNPIKRCSNSKRGIDRKLPVSTKYGLVSTKVGLASTETGRVGPSRIRLNLGPVSNTMCLKRRSGG